MIWTHFLQDLFINLYKIYHYQKICQHPKCGNNGEYSCIHIVCELCYGCKSTNESKSSQSIVVQSHYFNSGGTIILNKSQTGSLR